MKEAKQFDVLLEPRFSEKGFQGGFAAPIYAFKVAKKATKSEIKHAVEHFFSVHVKSVRVLNVKGKQTFFKRIRGRHNGWRKAYVTLAEGEEINLE